jgi:hypothetical protein
VAPENVVPRQPAIHGTEFPGEFEHAKLAVNGLLVLCQAGRSAFARPVLLALLSPPCEQSPTGRPVMTQQPTYTVTTTYFSSTETGTVSASNGPLASTPFRVMRFHQV